MAGVLCTLEICGEIEVSTSSPCDSDILIRRVVAKDIWCQRYECFFGTGVEAGAGDEARCQQKERDGIEGVGCRRWRRDMADA